VSLQQAEGIHSPTAGHQSGRIAVMKAPVFLVFTLLLACGEQGMAWQDPYQQVSGFSGGPYGMGPFDGPLAKRSGAFAVSPYQTGPFGGPLTKRDEVFETAPGIMKRAPLGSRSSGDFLDSLVSGGDSIYGIDDPYMDRAWGGLPQKRRAGSKAYAQWISNMNKENAK